MGLKREALDRLAWIPRRGRTPSRKALSRRPAGVRTEAVDQLIDDVPLFVIGKGIAPRGHRPTGNAIHHPPPQFALGMKGHVKR